MEETIDILDTFQSFLPSLFGGFLLGGALRLFGRDEKMERNHLAYASIAFFILSAAQALFLGVQLSCKYLPFCIPTLILDFIHALLIALASVLMIVGGMVFCRLFAWMSKAVATVGFVALYTSSAYIFLTATDEEKVILPTVYLATGLIIFGFFALLQRPTKTRSVTLKFSVLWIFALAFYYLQQLSPKYGTESPFLETFLYFLLLASIYRATQKQLKKDLVAMKNDLTEARKRIPEMIQSSPFPIMISNLKDDRLILVNDKASHLFKITPDTINDFRTEQYYVDANARKELLQQLTLSPTVENFQAELHRPGSKETFWLEISARVMEFENEIVLYSAFKDITSQKIHERELFEKAVLDPLTGCYNRRQFQELAGKEIRRAWRYNKSFCIAMIDIDHFKQVNDTHGHAFGDIVLKTMSSVCRHSLRDTDIFARYGGEEFVLLLSETDLEGGILVAERLRQNVANTNIPLPDGEPYSITISMGIIASGTFESLEDLVKGADTALYQAKETGRNKVCAYSQEENFKEVKKEALQEAPVTSQDFADTLVQQAQKKGN